MEILRYCTRDGKRLSNNHTLLGSSKDKTLNAKGMQHSTTALNRRCKPKTWGCLANDNDTTRQKIQKVVTTHETLDK